METNHVPLFASCKQQMLSAWHVVSFGAHELVETKTSLLQRVNLTQIVDDKLVRHSHVRKLSSHLDKFPNDHLEKFSSLN